MLHIMPTLSLFEAFARWRRWWPCRTWQVGSWILRIFPLLSILLILIRPVDLLRLGWHFVITGSGASLDWSPTRDGADKRAWFESVKDRFWDWEASIDHTEWFLKAGQKCDQRVLVRSICGCDIGCHLDPDESDYTNAIASVSKAMVRWRS